MKEQNNIAISHNFWFWTLQIVGWGIPTGLNYSAKIAFESELELNYLIAEGLLTFIGGIGSTTLLRSYLKRSIQFDKFKSTEVLKLLIGFVATGLIFGLILLIALPLYKMFHGKDLEITNIFLINNIINAFGFIFLWILFYTTIKSARKLRQNRIERLEMETTLKEAQLNTLKGQINPHFMFNSLNNIRGLMLEDVDKSREMITRLSEMLRYSLTKNNVDKIALQSELEMVDNYIALSKIQLEDRLHFSSEIEPALLKIEIPPMLIQMLIENAVKHGVANEKNGGNVFLKISEEQKKVFITITNTGTLDTESNSTKIGLKNIESRLQLIYGSSAKFSLSEKNHEVTALIQIPL